MSLDLEQPWPKKEHGDSAAKKLALPPASNDADLDIGMHLLYWGVLPNSTESF